MVVTGVCLAHVVVAALDDFKAVSDNLNMMTANHCFLTRGEIEKS